MKKIRIFIKDDDIAYDYPCGEYSDNDYEKINDCPIPQYLNHMMMYIVDENNLPQTDDGMKRYIEGGVWKVDSDWSKKIMPKKNILLKKREKLVIEMDSELSKENPDIAKIIKINRDLNDKFHPKKYKEWNDVAVYELALQGLDERVQNNEPDKPLIRQKLQTKINELLGI